MKWKELGRKPKRVQQEERWRGSPSTYGHLTFSSTANLHRHNEQELPEVIPLAPRPRPKRPMKDPDAKYKKRRERNWQRIMTPKDPDLLGPALSPRAKINRAKEKRRRHRANKGPRPRTSDATGAGPRLSSTVWFGDLAVEEGGAVVKCMGLGTVMLVCCTFAGRSVSWLVAWSGGWLLGQLVSLSVGWLGGWLVS